MLSHFDWKVINLTQGSMDFANQYIASTDRNVIGQFLVFTASFLMLFLLNVTLVPFITAIHRFSVERKEEHDKKTTEKWKSALGRTGVVAAMATLNNWLVCGLYIVILMLLAMRNMISLEAAAYVMQPTSLFVIVILAPSLAILSALCGEIALVKTRNITVAYSSAGLFVLPFIFVIFLQLFNVFLINWSFILTGTVFLLYFDLVLFYHVGLR